MSDRKETETQNKNEKAAQKSKPYKLTFSETYVEPIGMGEPKKKD